MQCCTLKNDVAALALGITLLCAGSVTLIGAGGFVLWMMGIH